MSLCTILHCAFAYIKHMLNDEQRGNVIRDFKMHSSESLQSSFSIKAAENNGVLSVREYDVF